MNGGSAGWDFVYEPDVQLIADSLIGELRRQLDEIEQTLLTDQTENRPKVRYRHGLTTIGIVTTENIKLYFQPVNPFLVRIIDIHIYA